MSKKIKDIIAVFAPLLGAAIVGAMVALYTWGGPSTAQVQAIYDLGRLQRCWNCFQPVDKDAPVGVIRFHANGDCIKEGKPW